MNNLKDKITNYVAVLLILVEAVNTYLQAHAGQPFDWKLFSLTIGAAIVAWFTGKTPSGAVKTPGQVAAGNEVDSTVVKS